MKLTVEEIVSDSKSPQEETVEEQTLPVSYCLFKLS